MEVGRCCWSLPARLAPRNAALRSRKRVVMDVRFTSVVLSAQRLHVQLSARLPTPTAERRAARRDSRTCSAGAICGRRDAVALGIQKALGRTPKFYESDCQGRSSPSLIAFLFSPLQSAPSALERKTCGFCGWAEQSCAVDS